MAAELSGVLLPAITPFTGGKVDISAYKKMLGHYLGKGIHGVVPLGTTGEAPTIEEDEYHSIVQATLDIAKDKVPVYVGVSSNSTNKAIHLVRDLDRYPVKGYLVTSPYYNLPPQAGIFEHFKALSGATDKQVLIYNIPYRTGRNVENETILKLSAVPNIVGIKDSCGIMAQSIELIRDRDPAFSVLTGEDLFFYFNITAGGNGGILASAHVQTERFIKVWEAVKGSDLRSALAEWNKLSRLIPLLFKEPNPGPIKYILAKKGIIPSAEVRAPLAPISEGLQGILDRLMDDGAL